jgi:hypothetical protein
MNSTVVAIAAAGFLIVIVSLIITSRLAARKSERIKALAVQKVKHITNQHMMALVRRRNQLVQPDAYGKLKMDKWAKEVDSFILDHIGPFITPEEVMTLARHSLDAATIVEILVSAASSEPAFQAFSDTMKPADFEAYCAEQLRRTGWNARVTMQSRDQGVDVIADKNNVRVVLQCKLYANPVGNKAVQEAAAGRIHEQADYGIVVTNNRYTQSAEELAATNGILLLHYRDLSNLETILAGIAIKVGGQFDDVTAHHLVPISNTHFDQTRWYTLMERDTELAMVANKLRPLGQKWVDKFAASYLAVNDKRFLSSIVSKVISDARKEYEEGRSNTTGR